MFFTTQPWRSSIQFKHTRTKKRSSLGHHNQEAFVTPFMHHFCSIWAPFWSNIPSKMHVKMNFEAVVAAMSRHAPAVARHSGHHRFEIHSTAAPIPPGLIRNSRSAGQCGCVSAGLCQMGCKCDPNGANMDRKWSSNEAQMGRGGTNGAQMGPSEVFVKLTWAK